MTLPLAQSLSDNPKAGLIIVCILLALVGWWDSKASAKRVPTKALTNGLDWRMPELYHDDWGRNRFKEEMVESIMAHLVFCKRRKDDKVLHLRSCRTAHGGCQERIETLTGYILDTAERYDLNPWLMAGVAFNESRFNPFAVGPTVGSRGIFQINPKTRRGRRIKFIRNERYRKRCKRTPGNCQQEIVNAGGAMLRGFIKKCGGLAAGLSMYNAGRCDLRRKYIKNTTAAWKSLMHYDRNDYAPWCNSKRKNMKNVGREKSV